MYAIMDVISNKAASGLRFLQTHPFWLYKVAGVSLALHFVMALAFEVLQRQEFTVYPVLLVAAPFISGCILISVFALGLSLVLAIIRRIQLRIKRLPGNKLWAHFIVAGGLVVSGIVVLAITGPIASYQSVASIQINNRTFTVVADRNLFASAGHGLSASHTLYECDHFQLVCLKVYEAYVLVDHGLCGTIEKPSYVCPTSVELAIVNDEVAILVDNEIIYSYDPISSHFAH